MTDFPIALTVPKTDSSDFTEWLRPDSRLPSDIEFHVKSLCSNGTVLEESISGHKAILAKASNFFDDLFFNNSYEVHELEVKCGSSGLPGIQAFKLLICSIYGRKIKMEEVEDFQVLANLAGFPQKYKVDEVMSSALSRMVELVEEEGDFEKLTKISSMASRFGLSSLVESTSSKIKAVITMELNGSVLNKFNSLKEAGEKEKIKILLDLADLGIKHHVASLKSAICGHLDALEVNEENFSDLVRLADSSQLMAPIRKSLARYIRAHYGYSEELSFFLKSQQNLDLGNLYSILCQVHEKE